MSTIQGTSDLNSEMQSEAMEALERIRLQSAEALRASRGSSSSDSEAVLNLGNLHSDFPECSAPRTAAHGPFVPAVGLKLDDIISSFKSFKGDGHSNFKKWLLHFEEQCCVFQLSEMQKFIFAKRILKGVAKAFVDHESTAVTWRELKTELKAEFNQPINSVLIHQKLSQRKKKTSEVEYQCRVSRVI